MGIHDLEYLVYFVEVFLFVVSYYFFSGESVVAVATIDQLEIATLLLEVLLLPLQAVIVLAQMAGQLHVVYHLRVGTTHARERLHSAKRTLVLEGFFCTFHAGRT